MRRRIEQIGSTFLLGYHAALAHDGTQQLGVELEGTELELRGFAYEGAAMGLALLDCLSPWRSTRLEQFLGGAGEPHAYMLHVGAGWVWARLPWRDRRAERRFDPVLRWLAFDGWGFHGGFFNWPRFIKGQPIPHRLTGYERCAFDQGLGRSLWFVNGGNPELIAGTIRDFSAARQPDLWSGVGLAACYAGFATEKQLGVLRKGSGAHWPQLAQGAAFACKARQRAGNLTAYTDLAARVLTGLTAVTAAQLSDATLENLPADGEQPAYEIWRWRIHQAFKSRGEPVTVAPTSELANPS